MSIKLHVNPAYLHPRVFKIENAILNKIKTCNTDGDEDFWLAVCYEINMRIIKMTPAL